MRFIADEQRSVRPLLRPYVGATISQLYHLGLTSREAKSAAKVGCYKGGLVRE
jgi:hypothetical protein